MSNMNNNIAKLYAAYRSGCLGDNIFHAYYSFLANIISEEEWDIVDETQVAEKFRVKYSISLPLNFVRQILGVGMERNEIIHAQGKYLAQKEKFRSYSIDNKGFNSHWQYMLEGFNSYCKKKDFGLSDINVEARIFSFLDVYDETILSNDELYVPEKYDAFHHIWHSYLKDLSENDPQLFDFVVAISFSNILKETVFYSSDTVKAKDTYSGLNVYLDSPIVFALLGMDSTKTRVDSCKMLVAEMQKAGCSVQIFDHNFEEIKGIMERAAGWAISVEYDIQKANNVAHFFHDELMEAPAIAEFCEL